MPVQQVGEDEEKLKPKRLSQGIVDPPHSQKQWAKFVIESQNYRGDVRDQTKLQLYYRIPQGFLRDFCTRGLPSAAVF